MDGNTGVTTIHPEYIARTGDWLKMYDVCISESHIHLQGEKYLPKLDEMTDEQYEAYVKRAEFPMFTKHALEAFVGMSMRKDLLITGIDVNHDFFKNCDGKGTTLKHYAEKLVLNFLQYGRCGTLVDVPPANPNQSVAEAEAANIKPKLAFYDYESIINWKVDEVNNRDILTLVTLREEINVSDNVFGHQTEYQYRVLRLEDGVYYQELYDHNGAKTESFTPMMGSQPLKYIPFIIHGGPEVKMPIMLPIAEQNVHWYMKDADYQHGLHWTALPTPWVIGVDANDPNKPTTIGPQKMWFLPIGASCGMLEFDGKGLAEINKSIEKTMSNITVLSSQILVPKNTFDETATAASIRNASETASLSSMVSSLSGELTIAVVTASKWGKFYVEDTQVEINSDFIPLTLSGADVSAYVSSVLKEGFSKKTLFELLKKGEIIEGDRQFDDEMADIQKESDERRQKEVDQAEALAKVEAKVDLLLQKSAENDPGKEGPDTPQRRTQGEAGEQSTNSGDQISGNQE